MANPKTVLIVDDEPMVRMLMVDVLQDMGYCAIEAVDGTSALKILQSDTTVDLLVTDVGLPGGIDGRQLADSARALWPDLGVLFITGYADMHSEGQIGLNMQVMSKPFQMEALAEKVGTMLAA